MCPVTMGLALGAATSVLSITGQKNMAEAQARAQNQQTKAEQQRLLQQQAAERINQRFQQEQASQQIQKASVKAAEARSTARVSAGEAGVSGISVDALANDLTRKQAIYEFGVRNQLEQSNTATELRMEDNVLGSQQRILSINQPIEEPDYFGGILKGATTGINTYSTLSSIET